MELAVGEELELAVVPEEPQAAAAVMTSAAMTAPVTVRRAVHTVRIWVPFWRRVAGWFGGIEWARQAWRRARSRIRRMASPPLGRTTVIACNSALVMFCTSG